MSSMIVLIYLEYFAFIVLVTMMSLSDQLGLVVCYNCGMVGQIEGGAGMRIVKAMGRR